MAARVLRDAAPACPPEPVTGPCVRPRLRRLTCRPLMPRAAAGAGIPPLERSYEERYGGQPAYEAYKKATNLLLPWPPRDKFP